MQRLEAGTGVRVAAGVRLGGRLILAAAALSAMPACLKPAPQTVYYQIPYRPSEKPLCTQPLAVSVGVPGFEARLGRDRVSLAYRSTPYRLEFYSYREWLAQPDEMLNEILIQALVDSGCFLSVVTPPYSGEVDYEVSGYLERLEQVETPGRWSAAVGWRAILSGADDRVLWRARLDGEKPAEALEAESVVRAASALVDEEIRNLVGRIRDSVVQDLEQRAAKPGE